MGKKKAIPIICFAEGKEGSWEAICMNFDLAAQGESFTEVYDILNVMIEDYIKAVSELPASECRRLLNRRVPLSLRLRFTWLYLLANLGRRSDKERHNYTANACPA